MSSVGWAGRRRYFAYGSDLCAARMAEGCPAAEPGGTAWLAGWRFVVNRRGVATIVPDPAARVAGRVWHLTAECEAELDLREGVALGVYRKETVGAGGAPALAYVAAEAR